jgi:hypothetical protein
MLNDNAASIMNFTIKESIMSYTIKQSYSDDTQSEFEVFNSDNQRIGYYVTDTAADCIEVYSSPADDFDDYFRIDYVDNAEEAFDMIVSNYEYA